MYLIIRITIADPCRMSNVPTERGELLSSPFGIYIYGLGSIKPLDQSIDWSIGWRIDWLIDFQGNANPLPVVFISRYILWLLTGLRHIKHKLNISLFKLYLILLFTFVLDLRGAQLCSVRDHLFWFHYIQCLSAARFHHLLYVQVSFILLKTAFKRWQGRNKNDVTF